MKTTYECGVCGVISDERDQLCHPQSLIGKHDSCHPSQDKNEICASMEDKVSYSCASCGRPADDPRLICDPQRRD